MPTVNINDKQIDVEQLKSDWALALMSQGVIVKLAISRWRATAKLTPEILGLRFAGNESYDFMEGYIRLGKQKLLPLKVIKNIEHSERRARIVLENHSFDTVWGRFVPFKAYKSWEQENQIARQEFLENAKAIGHQYNEIVNLIKEEYKKMAKDVWFRLYPNGGEPTVAFISDFVDKIAAKIPSQVDIVESFKFDTTYFIIPMPSFIQENIARAEQVKRQIEMDQFNNDLEKETRQKISEEYIQRKKELIDGFLESTVVSMRRYVSELCDAVLHSLQQQGISGEITERHTKKLREMIKKVRLLNFYDDNEISKLLSSLEIAVCRDRGELDKNTIVNKLMEIVEIGEKEFIPSDFNAISLLEL